MPEAVEGKSGVDRRKVFVIHGRNDRARLGLFTFLRAIDLDPIEWSEASRITGKGSPYIGEILDAAFGSAQAVVVLQTPDDVTYLHESLTEPGDPECNPQMQPRPNVLFEAGMAMGRDADRTVIVELGRIKVFSDIHGRHVIRLNNSVQKRQDLANRLETAGCAINLAGTDWHEAGDLTPPASPGNGLPLGRRLPSSQTPGRPRLQASYVNNGSGKLHAVQITNHGPGDVYELDVDAENEVGLVARNANEFPVPVLPAGKSVSVMRMSHGGLGHQSNSYFNVTITGKTADGSPIVVNEFVSGA
ncbi:TIR domain-containing protein [Streptomyces sp. NPDC060085]|uniref:TIR domain-containing protein n=1 Tax=Streptomyces sp. NPDC060085 TaxID=3347054 RepID=UPI003646302B